MSTNPAARLHNLVVLAKQSPEGSPYRIWAGPFELPPEDINPDNILQITEQLIQLDKLIDEVESGFRLLDLEPQYFEPFRPLHKTVFESLHGLSRNVSGLMSVVTERHLTVLELGAIRWDRKNPESTIDQEQLKEILKQARELFEAVKAADLNEDVRRLVLSLLMAIEQAIQQSRVRGPERLKEGLSLIIGQFNWNADVVTSAAKDATSSDWLRRVYGLGAKLWAVVTFAEKTQKTLEAAAPVVRLLLNDPTIPPIDLPK